VLNDDGGISSDPRITTAVIAAGVRGQRAGVSPISIESKARIPVFRSRSMDATLTMQAPPNAAAPSGDPPLNEAPLSADELRKLDAYWRTAKHLSVGQIYLLDNPLLREPSRREHITEAAWPLGHLAGPEHALRAPQPGDQAG
jgi:hypothetical protein